MAPTILRRRHDVSMHLVYEQRKYKFHLHIGLMSQTDDLKMSVEK